MKKSGNSVLAGKAVGGESGVPFGHTALLPSIASLEAIRVYGSAPEDFGYLPAPLETYLKEGAIFPS